MVCCRNVKKGFYSKEIEVDVRIILTGLFKFRWQEVKSTGLSQDGENVWTFVITVMNIWFHNGGWWIFLLFWKASFLRIVLQVTQFINTYIDPVCPDRLTLRYCSCNTYLLHRRVELKAAPGSTWLMRNWTLGNNEPLTVYTYVCGLLTWRIQWAPSNASNFNAYHLVTWVCQGCQPRLFLCTISQHWINREMCPVLYLFANT